MIEKREIMTNESLISWLGVLGKGYVKPDLNTGQSSNTTGVVTETKNYMGFIMAINSELCQRAGIECPDITKFIDR